MSPREHWRALPSATRKWACAVILAKFTPATQRRMLYPYAPNLAARMGITVQHVADLIAAMQTCYLIACFSVPALLRRFDVRGVLVAGTGIAAVAFLALGLARHAATGMLYAASEGDFLPANGLVYQVDPASGAVREVAASKGTYANDGVYVVGTRST